MKYIIKSIVYFPFRKTVHDLGEGIYFVVQFLSNKVIPDKENIVTSKEVYKKCVRRIRT